MITTGRGQILPADSEMQDIDPKGLDTAFWASVTKEDIYEYLYFLNRECCLLYTSRCV